MLFQKDNEEEMNLNYQLKKIVHMIELQIMDIESTLHYIQKKHTTHQIKEALSQIYNIFNETEPIFKHIKGSFLHGSVKKLMNCFGIIYIILNDHIDNGKKSNEMEILQGSPQQLLVKGKFLENGKMMKETAVTESLNDKKMVASHRPFGGIYLYNQNYRRHINAGREPKLKAIVDKNGIQSLTKEQFRHSVMQQINDLSYGMPHPDEMLDLFTFKFKYGGQSQVVTFHDELQSIAKYFRDAQNDAFDFLNKTKDQNVNFSYNESFKEIMGHAKLDKEKKLKEFNQKIGLIFRSIKRKTEKKMQEIEIKLGEAEEIKNNYRPPVTAQRSTQTSYNFEDQLKYLNRRLQDAEQKYKMMYQIKKKEIEQSALAEIELQNELNLKAREIVYLKLSLQQNSLVIANLNKKNKLLTDTQKKIKQRFLSEGVDKSQQKIIASLQDLQSVNNSVENTVEEGMKNINAIESIRKQKKVVRKIIVQAKKNSQVTPKTQFAKRLTQQSSIIPGVASFGLLDKWNLSEISEKTDSEVGNKSITSNMNNLLTENRIKTNNKIPVNIKEQIKQSLTKQFGSSQSIKSALERENSRKQTREKKTSHFIDLHRKESILQQKSRPESIEEDSLFGSSDSNTERQALESQTGMDSFISDQEMKKIEIMYQRQINRFRSRINDKKNNSQQLRSPSGFYQLNSSAKQRTISNSFQLASNKKLNERASMYSGNSMSIHKNSFQGGLAEAMSIAQREDELRQTNTAEEQEDATSNNYVRSLQAKIEQLQVQIERMGRAERKICEKQISIMIEPQRIAGVSFKGKHDRFVESKIQKMEMLESKTNKVRFEMIADGDYLEFRNQKNGQLSTIKQKKGIRTGNRTATQTFFRSPSQSKASDIKFKNASQHVKRQQNRQNINFLRLNTEKIGQRSGQRSSSNVFPRQPEQKKTYKSEIVAVKQNQLELGGSVEQIDPVQNYIQGEEKENVENSCAFVKNKKVEGWSRSDSKFIESKQRQKQGEKQRSEKDQAEEKLVGEMAMKCKNLKEFKERIVSLHRERCGQNCSHLQQYVSNFVKYRDEGKSKLKMHIENIHNSIQGNPFELPLLRRKK